MTTDRLVSVSEVCLHHNLKANFFSSLLQSGLIKVVTIHEQDFMGSDEIQQLEKIIRFYYELDINLEGIETVRHLLNRMEDMQAEITELKNRIRLYEVRV